MNIETILNPIDGSDHSMNATRHAIDLAKVFNAKIILLHCHARFPIVLAEPYFQQAIDGIQKESEKLIEPYIAVLENAEVEFEVRILEGTPGNRIPDIAQIQKVDLIVMGSRGMTDFTGLFLGSVAHQVLHKSDCPVFITK
jgi:nucleotide-binding universal stress UspA family protein